jgi:hypothetical protein
VPATDEVNTVVPLSGHPAGLLFDSAGDLFGAASGTSNGGSAIFKISAGTHYFTTLATLSGDVENGYYASPLIPDRDGNLYGATFGGFDTGNGTVFELSGSGFVVGQAAPVIFSQPANQTAVANTAASFTAVCNSSPTPTVQWQVSTDGGKTFSDITGNASATAQTLTLTGVTPSQNGTKYRAIFTNSLGTSITDTVKLAVVPLLLVSPAHASPSPVTGTTMALSALADSATGEAGPTYKWSILRVPAGAASPTFSTNETTAARHTVVTFRKAGRYEFRCTVTDGHGDTVKSDVEVEVTQQATSLRLSPHNAAVPIGQSITIQAREYDQFGHPLADQGVPTFSTAGGSDTINTTTGLFTADTFGSALIQVEDGDLSATLGLQVLP